MRGRRRRGFATVLLAVTASGSPEGSEVWTGTVVTEATIHEGGGDHPQKTSIRLHLVETGREKVPGGYRIGLRSHDSAYDVENSMHGLIECSGKGRQTVSDKQALSAILAAPTETSYHLVLTRAFYSFNCGGELIHGEQHHGRMVGIGTTPPIDLSVLGVGTSVEVEDSQPRSLEGGGAVMRGSFVTKRHVDTGPRKAAIDYDYSVKWEICRGDSYCGK